MPLTQNWRSKTSWLFKKMKRAYQNYRKNKKFVETGAVMALK